MKISISNCNNFDQTEIELSNRKLNIKYAYNGTGKTTISKAIVAQVIGDSELLNSLTPFKYMGDSGNRPCVTGICDWTTVKIFNEDYIEQYIFQKDEILKNSFDIFIRTSEYDQHMANIQAQVEILKKLFKDNPDLETFLNDINIFIEGFGKAKGGYSKSGSIGKGLSNGNKLSNIPVGLEEYSDFLRQDLQTVKWLKWQMEGQTYSGSSDKCPYCANDIQSAKTRISKVSEEFDSKSIEHLLKMLGVFDMLSQYFTLDTNNKIKLIANNANGLEKDQLSFLLGIKTEVVSLKDKLEKIKGISFVSLKDVDKVVEELRSYIIDITFLEHLNCPYTSERVEIINKSIDDILGKAGQLQGEINRQKDQILKTVKKYNNDINEFLRYAGYKYAVSLNEDDDFVIRLKIKHQESDGETLDNAKKYLSFGERNAFALVLFMYDAINTNPDLIILDDPISSFDGNKKFAILNKLFAGGKENSFFERTVLLLTHEFSTIIDTVYNLSYIFNFPCASYLENHNGQVVEKVILKKDIQSFYEISLDNINNSPEIISKLIYLRRFLELDESKNIGWQLLSNYFKKRKVPVYRDPIDGETRNMTEEEISSSEFIIRMYINDFVYSQEINIVQDPEHLREKYRVANNNYEKLQIYRMIHGADADSRVITKFINETYHVENDYLFQLNPLKYELIPDYIIFECDAEVYK